MVFVGNIWARSTGTNHDVAKKAATQKYDKNILLERAKRLKIDRV